MVGVIWKPDQNVIIQSQYRKLNRRENKQPTKILVLNNINCHTEKQKREKQESNRDGAGSPSGFLQ